MHWTSEYTNTFSYSHWKCHKVQYRSWDFKIRIVNMKIDQKINILFCTKIHKFKIKIASFVLLKYILNARFHWFHPRMFFFFIFLYLRAFLFSCKMWFSTACCRITGALLGVEFSLEQVCHKTDFNGQQNLTRQRASWELANVSV